MSRPILHRPRERRGQTKLSKGSRGSGERECSVITVGRKDMCQDSVPITLYSIGWKEGLRRAGTMNGHRVDDIMLDTGCSKTMVHRHLVSKGELVEGKSSVVRCAHGDSMVYPMANVCIEIDGHKFRTEATVSDNLPVDVLLGTDIPALGSLIQGRQSHGDAMVATTRSMARKEALVEQVNQKRQEESGVRPTALLGPETSNEVWDLDSTLDDSILEGGERKKPYLTYKTAET